MGNAAIWFYPDPLGTAYTIDLGEPLTQLEDQPARILSSSQSFTGSRTIVHHWAGARYRIEWSRYTSAPRQRDIEALADHLRRGGVFSLAEDTAKAVAFFSTVLPTPASPTVIPAGYPWPYATTPSLDTSDEVVLTSPSPVRLCEMALPTAAFSAGASMTLDGLRFDYSTERWVLVRHRGFYPALRLPTEMLQQQINTTDHRINWTADFVAEEATSLLETVANVPDLPFATDDFPNFNVPDGPAPNGIAIDAGPRTWVAPR